MMIDKGWSSNGLIAQEVIQLINSKIIDWIGWSEKQGWRNL